MEEPGEDSQEAVPGLDLPLFRTLGPGERYLFRLTPETGVIFCYSRSSPDGDRFFTYSLTLNDSGQVVVCGPQSDRRIAAFVPGESAQPPDEYWIGPHQLSPDRSDFLFIAHRVAVRVHTFQLPKFRLD